MQLLRMLWNITEYDQSGDASAARPFAEGPLGGKAEFSLHDISRVPRKTILDAGVESSGSIAPPALRLYERKIK